MYLAALNMHRVSATTDAENKAAQNLFQRLGFRQEAHFVEHVWFKGAWGSEYVFAMLQREWQVRPNPHRVTPRQTPRWQLSCSPIAQLGCGPFTRDFRRAHYFNSTVTLSILPVKALSPSL